MNPKASSEKLKRPFVIPLMGYPGIQLTHSTIKQNEFNWGLQFRTISKLAEKYKANGVFFMMDILEPTAAMLSPDSFWKFSGQFISKLIDDKFVKSRKACHREERSDEAIFIKQHVSRHPDCFASLAMTFSDFLRTTH